MLLGVLSSYEWSALWLSLRVAVVCVLVVMPVAVALGWLLARGRFVGKSLLDALVNLPLVLPPVVVGYVLLVALGRNGILGRTLDEWLEVRLAFTWQAAAIASAVMALPLAVRPVRQAVEQVDRGLEHAAATLGANPWRVWWSVTLPLAWPGVAMGAMLAFARSLGEFGATITFAGNIPEQTQTLPLAIWSATQTPGGDVAAMRLVVVSISLSFGALLVSETLARRVQRKWAAS